jgi:hypothetical protein
MDNFSEHINFLNADAQKLRTDVDKKVVAQQATDDKNLSQTYIETNDMLDQVGED